MVQFFKLGTWFGGIKETHEKCTNIFYMQSTKRGNNINVVSHSEKMGPKILTVHLPAAAGFTQQDISCN